MIVYIGKNPIDVKDIRAYYANIKKDMSSILKEYLSNEQDQYNAFNLGSLYMNVINDVEKAIYYYIISVKFYNKYALYSLGVIYENRKEYDTALSYYKDAKFADYYHAITKIGDIYRKRKEIDEAKSHYLSAIEKKEYMAAFKQGDIYLMDEGNMDAYRMIGDILDIEGDKNGAKENYIKACINGINEAKVSLIGITNIFQIY